MNKFCSWYLLRNYSLYRRTISIMFSNSPTQEYCAMCDSLLSQILITNPIIHLKKKKKKKTYNWDDD